MGERPIALEGRAPSAEELPQFVRELADATIIWQPIEATQFKSNIRGAAQRERQALRGRGRLPPQPPRRLARGAREGLALMAQAGR